MTSSTVFDGVERRGGRCRSPRRPARRACRAPRRASGGSARARSASRGPCRAARCPSPRRRPGRATRGAADRRWSRPSRSRPCSHGSTRGERIGDDVRGRVGDAVERAASAPARERRAAAQRVGLRAAPSAVGRRQTSCEVAMAQPQIASAGTSIQRRSFQLCQRRLDQLHALGAFGAASTCTARSRRRGG